VPAPGGAVDTGERGVTTLADKVVEKIAARAAVEVDHAVGLRRHLDGRDVGQPAVRAHAAVDGQSPRCAWSWPWTTRPRPARSPGRYASTSPAAPDASMSHVPAAAPPR